MRRACAGWRPRRRADWPPCSTAGPARHSRQQIKDELDRLRARLRLSAATPPRGPPASIEAPRENLDATLTLLAEILREPTFPDSELTQMRREEQLAALEEARARSAAGRVHRTSGARWPTTRGRAIRAHVWLPEEKAAALAAVGHGDGRGEAARLLGGVRRRLGGGARGGGRLRRGRGPRPARRARSARGAARGRSPAWRRPGRPLAAGEVRHRDPRQGERGAGRRCGAARSPTRRPRLRRRSPSATS